MEKKKESRFDPLSPAQRSERMSLIRGRDTGPEKIVRRLAWSMGYRYRLHLNKLPGKPDLVFIGRQKVVFVHGCFWHQHKNCRQYVMPRTRLEFWLPKLKSNSQRDAKNRRRLREAGWNVLVVWECQLKDEARLREKLHTFLEDL